MRKKAMFGIIIILLIGLTCGVFFISRQEQTQTIDNAGVSLNAEIKAKSLMYENVEYPMKPHLQTVLFIGTDSVDAYQQKEQSFMDYYNYSQADFLMLLVLDKDSNTAEIIQLNRDTMTDVPWLDVLGNYGGTEYKQLCLAFNYGDGGMKSCKNTVQAVSNLVFDAPIDYYIQIPMSAIALINDLVGGVPVTIPEDMTIIDPDFTMGATVRLRGGQAERFVRARMALDNDTNLARLTRQRLYMDSFQKCAKEAFRSDSKFAIKLVEKLSDSLQSNLTAQQLSELLTNLDKASLSPIHPPVGTLVQGAEHYEFYVDEPALWSNVKKAYCCD